MNHNDITTDTADHVRELQQYLRIIRRERDGFTDVPVDGRFGPDTAAAVRQFQTESGLEPTGDVDRGTWDSLVAAAQEIVYLHAMPTPVQGFRMNQPPLSVGDTGDSVWILQSVLFALSARYGNLPPSALPNGTYTDSTAAIVRSLQRRAGLRETGRVDKATWDAIVILYNQAL